MIISHKYKFIFIKTNKTAGTSIEVALSKHCGPQDILTPLGPEDEKLRNQLTGVGPQNYLKETKHFNRKDWLYFLLKRKRERTFFNHISAFEIRKKIDTTIWDTYYKFCFERHPFDRVISHYYWTYRDRETPSVEEYLNSGNIWNLKKKGRDLYTINGQVVVDRVCKYENIEDELEDIRIQLGIPEPLTLPRAKSRFRKDKRHYSEMFNTEMTQQLSSIFRDELEMYR